MTDKTKCVDPIYMKILKFGGTSVGSPEVLDSVLSIIKEGVKNNAESITVVVSAFSGVTDTLCAVAFNAAQGNEEYRPIFEEFAARHINTAQSLIQLAEHPRVLACVRETLNELEDAFLGIFFLKEASKRALDLIMSFGERLSAYIISQALCSRGVAALYCDARSLILTDEQFGQARVSMPRTAEKITEWFSSAQGVSIVTGFIGATHQGVTTTIGRGGSDYTAAIIGAATNASVIEIWTDVDGVMTADPRKVKTAAIIPHLTYIEALELSYFGAKIIYPPTMMPALEKQIPIHIKNTFNPSGAGTLINGTPLPSSSPIKGISSIPSLALLRIEGVGMIAAIGSAARIFGALARNTINVILITQASSEYSICIGVNASDASRAENAINEEFALERAANRMKLVHVEYDVSIVTVVGEGMRKIPGIAGKLFHTLGEHNINTVAIAQGSSELSISAVIAAKNEFHALNAIHAEFFSPKKIQPSVFLAGTGLIGKKLLDILAENPVAQVCGIANTQSMLVDEGGVDHTALLDRCEPASLEKFVERMCNSHLGRKVFVDCTASEALPGYYSAILANGISIVTPNKKGLSGSMEKYNELMQTAKNSTASFRYETTVGAALPVIATLYDLIQTGDRIHSIEAVLSGTLSYIFNNFCSGEETFSQIVRKAKEKGYTEPDPRDDLCGLDVARKILILARECGYALELADVAIEPLLPKECFEATSVEAFFESLASLDSAMDKKRKQLKQDGRMLRCIASLRDGKASLGLAEVDAHNPFATLSGSDNMVVFTTNRYCDTPLVVRGPGAGAGVTAAGVLADITKTLR